MLYRTHTIFSLLISISTFNYFPNLNKYLFILFVVLGGTIPDIDKATSKINQKLKITKPLTILMTHRGIFHTLILATLISFLTYKFIYPQAAIPILIGYTGHLLIDGLNHAGVNLIHPLQKLHIQGFIQTGSWTEHILTITLAIAFILKLKTMIF